MAPQKSPVTFAQIQTAVAEQLADKCEFVFLLGSAGTPRFHDESDLDLAAYFSQPCASSELFRLQQTLVDTFDREVDLVQLNSIDPIFARQVLETGREVSTSNRTKLNLWKAKMLSEYPDFKQSRKVIEQNLLNRKNYG